MFDSKDTDATILKLMGQRIADSRLQANMTQATLAEEAGVSKRTVERIESGESVQLANLIRILRVQDKLPLFSAVFPEPVTSPLQQLRAESGKAPTRQRARSVDQSHSDAVASTSKPTWQWGDE